MPKYILIEINAKLKHRGKVSNQDSFSRFYIFHFTSYDNNLSELDTTLYMKRPVALAKTVLTRKAAQKAKPSPRNCQHFWHIIIFQIILNAINQISSCWVIQVANFVLTCLSIVGFSQLGSEPSHYSFIVDWTPWKTVHCEFRGELKWGHPGSHYWNKYIGTVYVPFYKLIYILEKMQNKIYKNVYVLTKSKTMITFKYLSARMKPPC